MSRTVGRWARLVLGGAVGVTLLAPAGSAAGQGPEAPFELDNMSATQLLSFDPVPETSRVSIRSAPTAGLSAAATSVTALERAWGVDCGGQDVTVDGEYLCWHTSATPALTDGRVSQSEPPQVTNSTAPLADGGNSPMAAANMVPLPPPAWCHNSTPTHAVGMRFESCHKKIATAARMVTVNGRNVITGTGRMELVAWQYGTGSSAGVVAQTSVLLTAVTGDFGVPTIRGAYWCSGVCDNKSSKFETQPLTLHKPLFAIGEVVPSVPSGSSAQVSTNWSFNLTFPSGSTSGSATATALKARCDFNGAPGVSGKGCVVPWAAPILRYSLTGPAAAVAQHISQAQTSGLRRSLTRTTDTAIHAANRAKACPRSIKRPAGMQCDEYPFASTLEGGASGGQARVFQGCGLTPRAPDPGEGPIGFSRCLVPAAHNTKAGSDLSALYRSQRVLNGDIFGVLIVP